MTDITLTRDGHTNRRAASSCALCLVRPVQEAMLVTQSSTAGKWWTLLSTPCMHLTQHEIEAAHHD